MPMHIFIPGFILITIFMVLLHFDFNVRKVVKLTMLYTRSVRKYMLGMF